MTDVRKVLTQILMEVTTEEIKKACEDVSRHFSKKGIFVYSIYIMDGSNDICHIVVNRVTLVMFYLEH